MNLAESLRTHRRQRRWPPACSRSRYAARAPYFASMSPLITALRPGYCEVFLKKRRKVENHIGTVHVIAVCNACEMAMGVCDGSQRAEKICAGFRKA